MGSGALFELAVCWPSAVDDLPAFSTSFWRPSMVKLSWPATIAVASSSYWMPLSMSIIAIGNESLAKSVSNFHRYHALKKPPRFAHLLYLN